MRRPWVKIAVGAFVAALFGARWLALTTVDRAWAATLGVGPAHADIALLRAALGAVAFAAATVWYVGNLLLLYRQIGAVQVPRQVGDLEIVEHVPRRYILIGVLVTGAVLGAVSSHGAGDWWTLRALADVQMDTGDPDPVLGHPSGYYLFALPWERTLQRFALSLALVGTALLALLYTAVGAIRRQERGLVFVPFARWHLAALSGTLALALAWGFAQQPALLVGGLRGDAYDAVMRDVRIPVALVLVLMSLAVAAASLVWLKVDRARVPGVAWLTLLGAMVVGRWVVPPMAAAAWGTEGRRVAELTSAFARARREGFLLVSDTVPLALALPDPGYVNRHAADLAEAPLWDDYVLPGVLNRAAGTSTTGRIYSASLAALPRRGGTPVPVFLAAREPDETDRAAAPGAAGVMTVLAARAGPDGAPLFLPALEHPDATVPTPTDLELAVREIWFAPAAAGHVVTPGAALPAGIMVRGLWSRLSLAWALQFPGVLSTRRVPSGSVVVTERSVAARLARYAPFAAFGTAWPTIVDGRLLWVAWGYVAREIYPLGAAIGWRDERVRYLRAGFLGTVDAATGRTRAYLARRADPLSRAWQRLLPELVTGWDSVPAALSGQLRYPEELFNAQVQLLRGQARRARVAEPYWWVGTAPRDTAVRLRVRAVDEVALEPRVAAVIEGVLERGQPRLRVLSYPEPYTLAGPSELEAEFAAAAPGGATIPGRLRVIPFDDGAVALQAFYADSGTFMGMVAGWQGTVGAGATPLDALRHVTPRGDATSIPGATPFEAAQEWFRRLDRARSAGDWTAFGEAWNGLRRALGLPAGPSRVAPPPPRD
jgi:uncharacterized protein